MRKIAVALIGSAALCAVTAVVAHSATQGGDPVPAETEPGIPVTDPLVTAKCGTCHTRDDKGNLSRISWVRTTPEGWAQAIRRMGRQNGLQLTADEAKQIIKSLSDSHGLAPEEAKPVMYIPERRIIEETLIPNETVRGACAACHAFGQPMSWRRSKSDWVKLQNLHVALYAQADVQFRRRLRWDDSGRGPDAKTPGEVALEFLSKNAQLNTPEWAAWRARMRTPQLAGKWLVSAHAPGKGSYVGEMIVEPGTGKDTFKTRVSLTSVEDGSKLTRTGEGIVYAGYSWRGRSSGGAAAAAAPSDLNREAREAIWIAPDQATAEGRWFWGEYQEFGFDVKLTRAAGGPKVAAVTPSALKTGGGARVRILGDDLPADVTPAMISLGQGVRVDRIVSHSPTEIVAEVTVASDALVGAHDVVVAGAALERGLPIYQSVDYLKVTPETGMARLGSDVHPKGYQQFEAIGFANGPDGKPNTADDVALGAIPVDWSVEEFMAVYNDDDKKFVGQLSPQALFTPASDGPNPQRQWKRNNYGDVWVVATAKSEKDKFGKPLSARAYLVVTVPSYQRWDQPEVAQ